MHISARGLRGRRLIACSLLATTACLAVAGCQKAPPPTAESEVQKAKPDYEFTRFTLLPGEMVKPEKSIKPGHWAAGVLEAVSNHHDYQGQVAMEFISEQGRPLALESVASHLRTVRPAQLPNTQIKLLDVLLFADDAPHRFRLSTTLNSPTGRLALDGSEYISRLAAHQNYFVVLAETPEDYRYLLSIDAVRFPAGDSNDAPEEPHYRVTLPQDTTRVPLADDVMAWTTLAYVLWDGYDHERLSLDQRRAMLDWLHWGGQLIVSGPGSLDTLRGSFLEPYLPAQGGEAWRLAAADLAPLDEAWTTDGGHLNLERGLVGQKLVAAPSASPPLAATSDGEPLLLERAVGRGRVVVSAFRLTQRSLLEWRGFDGFFNACVLRRGPRVFSMTPSGGVRAEWEEGNRYDPALTTRLRFFSRDASPSERGSVKSLVERRAYARQAYWRRVAAEASIIPAITGLQVELPRLGPGVAAWDDYSAVAETARAAIRNAAGVIPPDASVVLKLVLAYVTVLVPLNWLLFRLIGRVELAWAAVPIISLVFAGAVTYVAQLNIGFARVATEVAVVEAQAEYPRAHVTRYQAMYSSLGARFSVDMGPSGGMALPFSPSSEGRDERSSATIDFHTSAHGSDAAQGPSRGRLDGFEIASNSTAMLHSEQMVDLGGAINFTSLGGNRRRVQNNTKLNLSGVGVVTEGRQAWLGDLEAGESREFDLLPPAPVDRFQIWSMQLNESSKTVSTSSRGRPPGAPISDPINLRSFYGLVHHGVRDGGTRLVGWTESELAAPRISPAPTNRQSATLVVVNLAYAPDDAPRVDAVGRPASAPAPSLLGLEPSAGPPAP